MRSSGVKYFDLSLKTILWQGTLDGAEGKGGFAILVY